MLPCNISNSEDKLIDGGEFQALAVAVVQCLKLEGMSIRRQKERTEWIIFTDLFGGREELGLDELGDVRRDARRVHHLNGVNDLRPE